MRRCRQEVIGRQFPAAVQTVRAAVEACPEDLWNDQERGSHLQHLAYHARYLVDLYLSDDYGDYAGIITTPRYSSSRPQLPDYADQCLAKCDEAVARLTDERARERRPQARSA